MQLRHVREPALVRRPGDAGEADDRSRGMSCAIAILARIQAWALDHKFPGSAALVCALDRVMGWMER